jgi:hypothetical protein
LSIFYLGQLVGLPTLNSILVHLGITSNTVQNNYAKLCKRLSNNTIHQIFEYIFEQHLSEELTKLNKKHGSNWSRELVTAVLDDSVFKQWLKQNDDNKAYESCYDHFFSGQVGHAVLGFQVVTFGITILGVFYPLYFESVKKEAQDAEKKGKETHRVAQKLLKKWATFTKNFAEQSTDKRTLPAIHFSCDSGYSSVELSEAAKNSGLIYISVPKKNHLFIINDQKIKLNEWIETTFITQEKEHQESQKDLKIEQKRPFFLRFKALYKSQEREVTLLAFRLNGSNKVSVIYTTDKNIKAKTLRRHWFQRTYIEQFFKLLKHSLKIQEARTTTKHAFEFKLLRFAFTALHIQKMIRFIRKNCTDFIRKGIGTLQNILQTNNDIKALLEQYL